MHRYVICISSACTWLSLRSALHSTDTFRSEHTAARSRSGDMNTVSGDHNQGIAAPAGNFSYSTINFINKPPEVPEDVEAGAWKLQSLSTRFTDKETRMLAVAALPKYADGTSESRRQGKSSRKRWVDLGTCKL